MVSVCILRTKLYPEGLNSTFVFELYEYLYVNIRALDSNVENTAARNRKFSNIN